MSIHRPSAADAPILHTVVHDWYRSVAERRGGSELVRDVGLLLPADQRASFNERFAACVIDSGFISRTNDAVEGFGVTLPNGVSLLYVIEAARRKGIGQALFQALRAERGSVELWAQPGDRALKSFAEALGLKARLLTMSESSGEDDA